MLLPVDIEPFRAPTAPVVGAAGLLAGRDRLVVGRLTLLVGHRLSARGWRSLTRGRSHAARRSERTHDPHGRAARTMAMGFGDARGGHLLLLSGTQVRAPQQRAWYMRL